MVSNQYYLAKSKNKQKHKFQRLWQPTVRMCLRTKIVLTWPVGPTENSLKRREGETLFLLCSLLFCCVAKDSGRKNGVRLFALAAVAFSTFTLCLLQPSFLFFCVLSLFSFIRCSFSISLSLNFSIFFLSV